MQRLIGSQHYVCFQNSSEHGLNLRSFGDLSEVLLKGSHRLSTIRSLGLPPLDECQRSVCNGESLTDVALLKTLIYCHFHPNETQQPLRLTRKEN